MKPAPTPLRTRRLARAAAPSVRHALLFLRCRRATGATPGRSAPPPALLTLH